MRANGRPDGGHGYVEITAVSGVVLPSGYELDLESQGRPDGQSCVLQARTCLLMWYGLENDFSYEVYLLITFLSYASLVSYGVR